MKTVVIRRLKDFDKWKNSKWSQGKLSTSHDPDDVISATEVITEVQDIKQVLLDTVRYRSALIGITSDNNYCVVRMAGIWLLKD